MVDSFFVLFFFFFNFKKEKKKWKNWFCYCCYVSLREHTELLIKWRNKTCIHSMLYTHWLATGVQHSFVLAYKDIVIIIIIILVIIIRGGRSISYYYYFFSNIR
jgi:hypothetical protein